ncbi:hypothetical protein KKF34_15590 [Myxococcota bacterium]|nr:hypothetical protein [Myxococcota bacterium]MBU1380363.1 hypothetical protein [Myxococcota bacterium]MBU1498298.1 hypothetical protein [Myxococcota bacterium]
MNNTDLFFRNGHIVNESPNGEFPADTIRARSYTGKVLGQTVIVRLEGDLLAPGADAEMEALGFENSGNSDILGHIRRRAPGFPAWVFINDPDNSTLALSIVKEMKKAGSRAVSKPGHAKDALTEIAARLEKSAVKILPSYFEECGRIFTRAGNKQYGAQFFEKARETERKYGLSPDRSGREDVFLEFALDGALSAKTLSALSKDISPNEDAASFYSFFMKLCISRTKAGIPPWESMAGDLESLGKKAGLKPAEVATAYLNECLNSKGLKEAPASLWKKWKTHLVNLMKQEHAVSVRMLNLFPKPRKESDDFTTAWMGILKDANAFKNIHEAKLKGLAAEWISKAIAWADNNTGIIHEAVDILEKRLKNDKLPVNYPQRRWYGINIDPVTAEKLLALGVSIEWAKNTSEEVSLTLSDWIHKVDDYPELPLVGGDKILSPLIINEFNSLCETEENRPILVKAVWLKPHLQKWLEMSIARLYQGGIFEVSPEIENFNSRTDSRFLSHFPDILEKLKTVDITRALHLNISRGTIDEFSWPAFEQAVEKLQTGGKKKRKEITVAGTFPNIILHNGVKALVIGPDSIISEHDFHLKTFSSVEKVDYVQGKFIVCGYDSEYDYKGYWSDRPTDIFDSDGFNSWQFKNAITLSDESICGGGRKLVAGDTKAFAGSQVFTDGKSVWQWENDKFHNFDPDTGKAGEEAFPPGYKKKEDNSWIRYYCDYIKGISSDFTGMKDGFYYYTNESEYDDEAEISLTSATILGKTKWKGKTDNNDLGIFMKFPGSDDLFAVTNYSYWGNIWFWGDGNSPNCIVNTEQVKSNWINVSLPPEYFHLLKARNLTDSKLLRKISLDQVSGLFNDVVALSDVKADEMLNAIGDIVKKHIKGIKDPVIISGVASLVKYTRDISETLAKLISDSTAGEGTYFSRIPEYELGQAIGQKITKTYYCSGDIAGNLQDICNFLSSDKMTEGNVIQATEIPWIELLDHIGAFIFTAASHRFELGYDTDRRKYIIDFLHLLLDMDFIKNHENYRKLRIMAPHDKHPWLFKTETEYEWDDDEFVIPDWFAKRDKSGTFVVHVDDDRGEDGVYMDVLACFASKGKLPKDIKLISDDPIQITQNDITRFIEILEAVQNGATLAFDPESLIEITEKCGNSPAEATILLTSLTSANTGFGDCKKAITSKYGISSGALESAMEYIFSLDRLKILKLYDGIIKNMPASAQWSSNVFTNLFIDNFLEIFGKQVPVDDEWLKVIDKSVSPGINSRLLLEAIMNPASSAFFTKDGVWEMGTYGDVNLVKDTDVFTPDFFEDFVKTVPVIATHFAGDKRLTANLKTALELARKRMTSPDYLMPAGYDYPDGKRKKLLKTWFDSLDGKPWKPSDDSDADAKFGKDTGLFKVYCDSDSVAAAYRPSKIKSDADRSAIQNVMTMLQSEHAVSGVQKYFESKEFENLVDILAKGTQEPFNPNPLVSAPEAVKKLAEKTGLDETSTSVFLQFLTLHSFSKKDICDTNAIKPKQYDEICASLVAKELLVEAKRKRVKRDHFLPGGWEELRSPSTPVETWKLSLYGIENTENGINPPLGPLMPLEPLSDLFAKAADRYLSGDVPGFVAAKSARRKR